MSFKRLEAEDFIVSAESITAPAWSTGTPKLTSFFKSTAQQASSQGNYYCSVYQVAAGNSDASVQFDISYGDKEGRGAKPFNPGVPGYSPTSVIYGQLHNIVVGDEEQDFKFGGIEQTSVYALSIDRKRYKEALLPGTFELTLKSGGTTLVLTDNSKDITSLSFNEAGRVYQIVKGTAGSPGSAISAGASPAGAVGAGMTSEGSYGLFLPDIGTIILNDAALRLAPAAGGISLATSDTTSSDSKNAGTVMFGRIEDGASFQLNSEETLSSNYAFIRARNAEFNYSENPSFISSSQGVVIYDDFINNPQTFITTIGLYNDNNDLLATAKLSKALKKDFTKEALIRVKLDF